MKHVGLAVFVLALFCPRVLPARSLNTSRVFCEFDAARPDAGPAWLVRRGNENAGDGPSLFRNGRTDHGYAGTLSSNGAVQGGSGRATSATRTSGWKQAGIYGLEFGTAAVGSFVSAAGALWATDAVLRVGEDVSPASLFIASGAYALASTFLSAGGTYLMGKLLGQRGSFGHALAGGAVGGLAGGGSLLALMTINDAPLFLIPAGLAFPAAGAVTSYNVWK